jgi:uncharacterized protein (TIGR02246 family)
MQATIETVVRMLQDAWNRRDHAAFAALFAQDADFIHILGGGGCGQDVIRLAHKQLFETIYAESRVDYRIEKIRPLPEQGAVVLLWQTLTYQDAGREVTMECRPTMVVSRIGGQPRIVLFQNTKVAGAGTADGDTRLLDRHPHAPVRRS